MDADERVRNDPRLDAFGTLGRQQFGQGIRTGGVDLFFAALECGARLDHPVDPHQAVAGRRTVKTEQPVLSEQEAAKGVDNALSRPTITDAGQQFVLKGLQASVDEILLGGEVVEHGLQRDVSRLGHLRHCDPIETAFQEQIERGRRDQLACLPLLALASPDRGQPRRGTGHPRLSPHPTLCCAILRATLALC